MAGVLVTIVQVSLTTAAIYLKISGQEAKGVRTCLNEYDSIAEVEDDASDYIILYKHKRFRRLVTRSLWICVL